MYKSLSYENPVTIKNLDFYIFSCWSFRCHSHVIYFWSRLPNVFKDQVTLFWCFYSYLRVHLEICWCFYCMILQGGFETFLLALIFVFPLDILLVTFVIFQFLRHLTKTSKKIITLKYIFVFVEWCYIFNILWHSMKMYVVLQLRKLKTQKKSSECHFRQTKIWPLDRKQQINVLDCFIFVTFMLADWNMPEGFHT